MDDEKRLEVAYKRVEEIEDEVEALMKSEDADLPLNPNGKWTAREMIVRYRTLLSNMANTLCARIDEQAEALTKAKIEGSLSEKILAAAEETPEGALIVSGDAPNELSVIVLRGIDGELLTSVVKALAKSLAGGTDDVLAVADKVYPAKMTDYQEFGRQGAPHLGTVVVQQAQTGKVRKAAGGPSEPENPLREVGEYVAQSAAKKVNRQVNLT